MGWHDSPEIDIAVGHSFTKTAMRLAPAKDASMLFSQRAWCGTCGAKGPILSPWEPLRIEQWQSGPLGLVHFESLGRRTGVDEETQSRFEALVGQWKTDTRFLSSTDAIALHPAYLRIIGFGPVVIPLLLRELAERPAMWFEALYALTGEDPAASEETVEGAARAWLAWGAANGYIDSDVDVAARA